MAADIENQFQDCLEGQFLIAMPGMADTRFERSVVYLCAHTAQGGAMGLVVNKSADNITFDELLDQLDIDGNFVVPSIDIHFGGPVDTGRGFVLHSNDYQKEDSTIQIGDHVGLTGTTDILKAIVGGDGPKRSLVALGYAGWAPGQLESEIRANGWLHCTADNNLLFDAAIEDRWESAMAKLGIDLSLLSGTAGNA